MGARTRSRASETSATRRAVSFLLCIYRCTVTICLSNFVSRNNMGETKWLPQESELLDREYANPEVQNILATREIGCLRKAANLIAMKYQKELGQRRPAETQAEFHARKASFKSRSTRAKMKILLAETQHEYEDRMDGIAAVS